MSLLAILTWLRFRNAFTSSQVRQQSVPLQCLLLAGEPKCRNFSPLLIYEIKRNLSPVTSLLAWRFDEWTSGVSWRHSTVVWGCWPAEFTPCDKVTLRPAWFSNMKSAWRREASPSRRHHLPLASTRLRRPFCAFGTFSSLTLLVAGWLSLPLLGGSLSGCTALLPVSSPLPLAQLAFDVAGASAEVDSDAARLRSAY